MYLPVSELKCMQVVPNAFKIVTKWSLNHMLFAVNLFIHAKVANNSDEFESKFSRTNRAELK